MTTHLFQINFGFGTHPSLTNEIDDILLALSLREFQSRREIAVRYSNDQRSVQQNNEWSRSAYFGTAGDRDGHVPNIDLLVNADISFADNESSILKELILELAQEEIVVKHALCLAKPSLRPIKVKVSIQLCEELCDGIFVLIRLHL